MNSQTGSFFMNIFCGRHLAPESWVGCEKGLRVLKSVEILTRDWRIQSCSGVSGLWLTISWCWLKSVYLRCGKEREKGLCDNERALFGRTGLLHSNWLSSALSVCTHSSLLENVKKEIVKPLLNDSYHHSIVVQEAKAKKSSMNDKVFHLFHEHVQGTSSLISLNSTCNSILLLGRRIWPVMIVLGGSLKVELGRSVGPVWFKNVNLWL
jgi:hypothetical protein